jgi:hypothetical protein
MMGRGESAGEEVVDVEWDVRSAVGHAGSTGVRRRLAASDAVTAFNWPEMAQLVFPELDEAADGENGDDNCDADAEWKKQRAAALRLRRKGRFVQEYMDRRAQAKWASENPSKPRCADRALARVPRSLR